MIIAIINNYVGYFLIRETFWNTNDVSITLAFLLEKLLQK